MTSHKDDFIKEVNEAIQNGNVPPKSKKIDLFQRVATSFHVFNLITELLQGQKPPTVPTQISLEALQQAKRYVEYAETQTEIVMKVSRCIHIAKAKKTIDHFPYVVMSNLTGNRSFSLRYIVRAKFANDLFLCAMESKVTS